MKEKPVLVTGATGYVGGRLVPHLLEVGYRVRALGRSVEKLKSRPQAHHRLAELAKGDVLDWESLRRACQGCWAAFYLVHSMTSARDFSAKDRQAAQNMAKAAAAAGMDRLIYLGGFGGGDDPYLSEHLRPRHEVARILHPDRCPPRSSGPP